jgi:hypothetical protein
MSSKASNVRKRKPAEAPEAAVVISDDQNPKESKARRVSTDASASNVVAPPKATGNASIANAPSVADAGQEMSLERIGALIQDLFRSNNIKVNAALDALNVNLLQNKCEKIVTVGGCFALVQLVNNCLENAIEKILACDQVTELTELADLKTLQNSLFVIARLMLRYTESRAGIAAIGGVEAVVKVMKVFPKCHHLQWFASAALINLTNRNIIGKNKAVETGGIEALLAAVNNHLDSPSVCGNACWALANIATYSKKNTGLLISLGGATAVAKVRTKWPDKEQVQERVRRLAEVISSEMKTWADEEYTF